MKEVKEDEMLKSDVGSKKYDTSFNGLTDDEKIDIAARRVLERYKKAFIELAK